MRQNTWFCIMHVMSRLGFFKPYCDFIEAFLRQLDGAFDRELKQSREWILEQKDYPHLGKFRNWFGFGWENVIKMLMIENDIIIDDNLIIYTGVNNSKLQKLVDESVSVQSLHRKASETHE